MKIKQTIEIALLLALIASLGYWLGYKHGRNSITFQTPGKLMQVGLAHREDKNTVSQFPSPPTSSPVLMPKAAPHVSLLSLAERESMLRARTSEVFSPRQGIEAAERRNLYEMQKYQQRALRDIESQSPSLPPMTSPTVLEQWQDLK